MYHISLAENETKLFLSTETVWEVSEALCCALMWLLKHQRSLVFFDALEKAALGSHERPCSFIQKCILLVRQTHLFSTANASFVIIPILNEFKRVCFTPITHLISVPQRIFFSQRVVKRCIFRTKRVFKTRIFLQRNLESVI